MAWQDIVNCSAFRRKLFAQKLYFTPWSSKNMLSFYPDWIHDPIKTQVDAANTKLWDFQVEIQLVKKDESFTGEAAKHTCLS